MVFQRLALGKLNEAVELYQQARKRRSAVAWHRLRIGLKEFRYIVENFLPERYEAWAGDLKAMQDQLGDVHDLDVLRGRLRKEAAKLDAEALARWVEKIAAERKARLDEFLAKASGPESPWLVWRAGFQWGHALVAASFPQRRTAWRIRSRRLVLRVPHPRFVRVGLLTFRRDPRGGAAFEGRSSFPNFRRNLAVSNHFNFHRPCGDACSKHATPAFFSLRERAARSRQLRDQQIEMRRVAEERDFLRFEVRDVPSRFPPGFCAGFSDSLTRIFSGENPSASANISAVCAART